jgi:hypothetical protein
MRKLALAAVLFSSTAALADTEDREVPAFNAVQISSGIRATIEIGRRKPVRLSGDAEVLALVETVVEDGALQVRFKPHAWSSHHGDRPVKVSIQTPELNSVGASGGSIVRAAFTRSDRSSIEASGGSEISARGVDARRISAHASGGSILEVSGSCDDVNLELSGGSQLHGRDFSARNAEVSGSGGSQAELKASGSIRGSLSGGSQLNITGGASARVATSGGSEVHTD